MIEDLRQRSLVDNPARQAIYDLGGDENTCVLVLPAVRARCKIVSGERGVSVHVLDPKSGRRLFGKRGGWMSPGELVAELYENPQIRKAWPRDEQELQELRRNMCSGIRRS